MPHYQIPDRLQGLQLSALSDAELPVSDPGFISFIEGNPAVEALPLAALTTISERILREEPILSLHYSAADGDPALLEALCVSLQQSYNIAASHDGLLITSGAQQAIDLSSGLLCQEGDVVFCEKPTYADALGTFRKHGLRPIPIAMEEDGLDIAELERALQRHAPRFLYLIPSFHNPTGRTLSLAKRQALMDVAQRYDLLILEDDPYGALRFAGEDIAPLKALDTMGNVLYIGSFSKVIAPGLRLGYLCGDPKLLGILAQMKQFDDLHSSNLVQRLAYHFLIDYDFAGHLQRLRQIYKHKCDLMLTALDRHLQGRLSFTRPEGGFFLWCELAPHIDVARFYERLSELKVAVAPGKVFLPDAEEEVRTFRLNFSAPSEAQIEEGIARIAEASRS